MFGASPDERYLKLQPLTGSHITLILGALEAPLLRVTEAKRKGGKMRHKSFFSAVADLIP